MPYRGTNAKRNVVHDKSTATIRSGSRDNFLSEKIESILKSNTYDEICINAHKSVKDFTWDAFIEKIKIEINKL